MEMQALQKVKDELTRSFNISQNEIDAVKRNVSKTTEALFTEKNVTVTDDVITLVHQRLLLNELLILEKNDWDDKKDKQGTYESAEPILSSFIMK